MAQRDSDSGQFRQFEYGQRKFGPTKKRSCTDCGCLLIFLIFMAMWAGLIGYLLRYVNVEQVIFPSDTYGHICGKGAYSDRPYLYFFNIFKCATELEATFLDGCPTPQVCVKQCPDVTFSVRSDPTYRDSELNHSICLDGVRPNRQNLYDLVEQKKCAKFYFRSQPIGGRCIPSIMYMMKNEVMDEMRHEAIGDPNGPPGGRLNTTELVQSHRNMSKLLIVLAFVDNTINDVAKTWKYIVAGLLMTMIICFIWITIMEYIAPHMVWLSILTLFILNAVILYWTVLHYMRVTNLLPSNDDSASDSPVISLPFMPKEAIPYVKLSREVDVSHFDFGALLKDSFEGYWKSPTIILIVIIFFSITFLILIMTCCCLFQRVRLAVSIIDEATDAVSAIKSTLLFPIIPFLFKILVIVLAIFTFVTIATGSQPKYQSPHTGKPCVPIMKNDQNCIQVRLFDRKFIYFSYGFSLFSMIWLLFFISGIGFLTLAGVFCEYYWTLDKRDVPFFSVLYSFGRTIRYHLGSIAYGSLIISIVRFIRVILEFIDKKCKQYPNNPCSQFLMGCCKCCLWCLEKFIKYISQNAYIMIAMYGKPFCQSARDAFSLIITNGVRALVLSSVTFFVLFLSKLACTGVSAVLAWFMINNRIPMLHVQAFNELDNYFIPLALYIFLAYLLTSSFFSIYYVAIDTIFLCYLEDSNNNDGSSEKPYYMTATMKEAINKSATLSRRNRGRGSD